MIAAAAGPDVLARTWAALDEVTDPEIPVVTIRELGILRDVALRTDGSVEVAITPTYSGCPAMEQIEDDVRAALGRAGIEAHVVTRLAPAWTTDWMTEGARTKLREYGIAPPHGSAASACATQAPATGGKVLQFAPRKRSWGPAPAVACPQCGSHNTTETSHFGSTACKALFKCLDCLEPFDHFKPY